MASRYEPGSGDFPLYDLALLRLAAPIAAPALDLLANEWPSGLLASALPVTITSGSNHSPRGFAHAELREVIDQIDPDDDGPKTAVPVQWLLSYGSAGAPYVQSGDSGGGFGSAFVQLASYRSWIDGTMAGDLADAQFARWTLALVPEPASWALALAGGLLLTGIARQRRR
ncbi:MAG: hypothetical protein Q8N44_10875 [Rubrivivax sp.]|nr:hypothetical protein [Rubrivivax sp.]MDP3084178.1 hypothetical protein [Rubrivivax sp.]